MMNESSYRAECDGLAKLWTESSVGGCIVVLANIHSGEPVDVVSESGELIATGLVGFSSNELPTMLGQRSSELFAELGKGYERKVIHRDVMVWRKDRGDR